MNNFIIRDSLGTFFNWLDTIPKDPSTLSLEIF